MAAPGAGRAAVTTDKRKFSCYLTPAGERDLEALYTALRTAAPLELRGVISRSTLAERAIGLALEDWKANGLDSAIAKTTVTLPAERDGDAVNG